METFKTPSRTALRKLSKMENGFDNLYDLAEDYENYGICYEC